MRPQDLECNTEQETSTNIKAFRYFTLSPSINYEETWQFDYINKTFNEENNNVEIDTLRGFKSYREYNTSVGLSTNLYGTFNFKKGRLKAIRHTFRPSISYSYRPDFKENHIQQVQKSIDPLDLDEYTVFDQGIYGAPSSGLSNSIGISLNNVIEGKLAPKDPDSDEEDEKITIINNLNFTTSYNMTADSLRWSPVRFTAGTRFFKDKLALNINGSFDPYQVNEDGARINQFNKNILRLTNIGITANYSIASTDFGKNKKDAPTNNVSGNGAQNAPDIIGADINPTDRIGPNNSSTASSTEEDEKETKLYKAYIPWNINFSYATNYFDNGIEPGAIGVHSLMFSGNIKLTPKWDIGFSSGYDIKEGAVTFSRFNIKRDLDSWQFNFNWVPFGRNSSYTFFIGVKSDMLRDLKWDKNKPPDRVLF